MWQHILLFKICIPFDPTVLGVCSKTIVLCIEREYILGGTVGKG